MSECQCPTQFPMIRVSEGKYRIGDTQTLIFVRVSPKRCELCKYIFIAKKLVGNACTYLEKNTNKTLRQNKVCCYLSLKSDKLCLAYVHFTRRGELPKETLIFYQKKKILMMWNIAVSLFWIMHPTTRLGALSKRG